MNTGDYVIGIKENQWLQYFVSKIVSYFGLKRYKLEKVLCLKQGENYQWNDTPFWHRDCFRLLTKQELIQYGLSNKDNMNNVVIKVTKKENGKEVIDFWKNIGVDTACLMGTQSEEDNEGGCFYYGLIEGRFDNYNLFQAQSNSKVKIIELPKKENKMKNDFCVSGGDDYIREAFIKMLEHNDYTPFTLPHASDFIYQKVPLTADFDDTKNFVYKTTKENKQTHFVLPNAWDQAKEAFLNYKKCSWKNDLKIGQWVWFSNADVTKAVRISNGEGDYIAKKKGYRITLETAKINVYIERVATEEEILQTIKEVAFEMGYKIGVYIKSLYDGDTGLITLETFEKSTSKEGMFMIDGGWFYNNLTDEWAEIIVNNQIFDVIKAENGDYKIEILKEGIKSLADGKLIPIEDWKRFANPANNIKFDLSKQFPFQSSFDCADIKVNICGARRIPISEFGRILRVWINNFDLPF